MKTLNLADVVNATQGKILSEKETQFHGVTTDTRRDLQGSLFIALRGDTFDAHDFIEQCVQKGVAAILLDRLTPVVEKLRSQVNFVTLIQVADTLKALQDLSHFERQKSKAKVLAITGSNGKTTSKEFAAAVIGEKFKVHYSKGSYNNHWGVPLTLLAQPETAEVAVVEMGMNHAGEIEGLVKIADPDVVVVTMVGRAHIEHFGSIEGIADAKAEIYRAARKDALRIFSLDNVHTRKMWEEHHRQGMTFSAQDSSADVFLQIEEMSISGLNLQGKIGAVSGRQTVAVFGEHNLTNIMVAASLALASGMSPAEIWSALPKCKTNWGRNQLVKTKRGAEILFDGYNANPDSMKALIANLALLKAKGKKIGVFAQMLELGDLSKPLHEELGRNVGQVDFDQVYFYGEDGAAFERGARLAGFKNTLIISGNYEEKVANEIASVLSKDDIAIVKGSRGMKLERFVLACDPVDFSLSKE